MSSHEWSEYAVQITHCSSGSSAQRCLMVVTPSHPGGMRMSTKATA